MGWNIGFGPFRMNEPLRPDGRCPVTSREATSTSVLTGKRLSSRSGWCSAFVTCPMRAVVSVTACLPALRASRPATGPPPRLTALTEVARLWWPGSIHRRAEVARLDQAGLPSELCRRPVEGHAALAQQVGAVRDV